MAGIHDQAHHIGDRRREIQLRFKPGFSGNAEIDRAGAYPIVDISSRAVFDMKLDARITRGEPADRAFVVLDELFCFAGNEKGGAST
nr:hypothetical protein [Paraburkholderia dipogonis]